MPETIIATGSKPTPVSDLSGYYQNPRRGDVELIKESLSTLGQYKAIVVNVGTKTGRQNEVLAGNHTLMAARELGWSMIDAQYVDVDDTTARKIVLVDNRSNDVSRYDNDILGDLLAEMDHDLSGTGWSQEAVDDLLMLNVKDLDDLADELGDESDEDHWPTLSFKISAETMARWRNATKVYDEDDNATMIAILTMFEAAQ